MLSTNNWIFKERLVKKLVDWCIGLYFINEVVSTNVVKLQLPTSMRIHSVMNISQIVQYREQVEEYKIEKVKPVEIEEVKRIGSKG